MIIIPFAEVPEGLYSISYQSNWRHPFIGKNDYDHMVVSVTSQVAVDVIEDEMTKCLSTDNAQCTRVKIMQISRLDTV